jgi:ATP-dependent 26S proteasome regulatory subunit
MDEALPRRFDIIVAFPIPDEAHRLSIWEGMFPRAAEREESLDFGTLTRKFELSGGEIRNVVLAQAYLAANYGQPRAKKEQASCR